MNVSIENLDRWKRLLKAKTTPLLPAYSKMFKRYGVETADEYYNIIRRNIENNTLQNLIDFYEKNKKNDMLMNLEKEKNTLKKKIETSRKSFTENIEIRLLTDADEQRAVELYTLFKVLMQESPEKSTYHTQDFILKNIMYGIFVNNMLVGFVIIQNEKKFIIDSFPEYKVDTFYIQELLIDPKFRGQRLSKYLLQYCIYICPKDKKFMSLMTMPDNLPLIKVAESCGFVSQKFPSGDKKHSLLMIRNMDHTERTVLSPKTSPSNVNRSSPKTSPSNVNRSSPKTSPSTVNRSSPKTSPSTVIRSSPKKSSR